MTIRSPPVITGIIRIKIKFIIGVDISNGFE